MRRKILAAVASVLLGGMLLAMGSCGGEFGSDVLSSFIGTSLADSLVRPG